MSAYSTDVLKVGAGASSGPAAKKLTEREIQVTVLAAGRRFGPAHDLPDTEAHGAKFPWRRGRIRKNRRSRPGPERAAAAAWKGDL